jgi:hypothetical protein
VYYVYLHPDSLYLQGTCEILVRCLRGTCKVVDVVLTPRSLVPTSFLFSPVLKPSLHLQIVSDYLTAYDGDSLFLQAQGRPVTLYSYRMQFSRHPQIAALAPQITTIGPQVPPLALQTASL